MQRQRAMGTKAESLAQEKDLERIQRLTAELEEEGRELERMARDFERQELAKAGPPPRGNLEVVLTPAQRARVAKLTGVDLASVVVRDEAGVLSQAMPSTDPRDIELLAIAEARKLAALRDGGGKIRAALESAIADIEQQGSGEVLAELERLKADPDWMGGLLHKK